MRVAVTGATGFTGKYLVDLLRSRGDDVLALEADLTDGNAIDVELANAPVIDAVVHLAAKAFVASDRFAEFYAVNQVGSFNLLAGVAARQPRARVLLASSAQVYGAQASGRLSEEAPLAPSNHYALSKAAMETGAGFWTDHLDMKVVRPFNYTGVGQESRYLIPKIVDHFARRAPVIELGNLNVRRDFGDVRAVVDAYCALLEPGRGGGAYNVSTGRASSVADVLDALSGITGHRPEVRTNPAFVRPDDVPELVGENAKLRAAAPGWAPRALEDTLRWMLDAAEDAGRG